MPTPIFNGKEVQDIELLEMFPASEGMIAQYYGRIGSGKTYAATHDILDLLKRGKVIYANWRIHYEGYDERKSLAWIIVSLLLPWRRRFYNFPADNLHYFEFSDIWARKQEKPEGGNYADFTEWLSTRTDCYIFGDEGHVMFDSYQGTRMSIDKRTAILHTRHFNRSIFIISQRPTAIHVAMRANVNVFYKCEQKWSFGPLIRFRRSEYQDMQNESVDEDEEKVISIKQYWGKKRVFEAYDTKYLRGGMPDSQKVMFTAYDYGLAGRIGLFIGYFFHRKSKPSIALSTFDETASPAVDVLPLEVHEEEERLPSGEGEPQDAAVSVQDARSSDVSDTGFPAKKEIAYVPTRPHISKQEEAAIPEHEELYTPQQERDGQLEKRGIRSATLVQERKNKVPLAYGTILPKLKEGREARKKASGLRF